MSEDKRVLATIKGFKSPSNTTIEIDGVVLEGVESINIAYRPDNVAIATITLIDFNATHKGGDDE